MDMLSFLQYDRIARITTPKRSVSSMHDTISPATRAGS